MKDEVSKGIEILRRTQAEGKMGLENETTQIQNSKGSLIGRMGQVKGRVHKLEFKVEDLDHKDKE